MTAVISTCPAGVPGRSPFAGLDICAAAGLVLAEGAAGPVFDQDVWDFSGVTGMPAYLQPSFRRLDFTAITNPAWRLVVKEHMAALLAPACERVRHLPGARRHPLTVTTCAQLLSHLTGHNTFRQQAASHLAAQHEELQRLRDHLARTSPAARTPALTVLHTHPKDTQP